jgi:hypothetical protein
LYSEAREWFPSQGQEFKMDAVSFIQESYTGNVRVLRENAKQFVGNGSVSLCMAAYRGQIALVRALATVETVKGKDADGLSPLDNALMSRQASPADKAEIIRILKDLGA